MSTDVDTDGRQRRWAEHRARRREELVAAGVGAVDATPGGVPGFDDVATAAGVGRTVVYRYFADVDDLHTAIAASLAEDLLGRVLGPLSAGRTAREIIEAVLGGIVEWVGDNPRRYGFLRQRAAGLDTPDGELGRIEETVAARLAVLLTAFMTGFGMPTDAAELGARSLVGLVESSVLWWVRQPPDVRMPAADLVTWLTRSVWAVIEAELVRSGVALALDDPLPE